MGNRVLFCALAAALSLHGAGSLTCDLTAYKTQPGLRADLHDGALSVTWTGAPGAELRAIFAIESGQPMIRELAARKSGGDWSILGQNLTPEYEVTSGMRRISEQQMAPLRQLGLTDPAFLEKQK